MTCARKFSFLVSLGCILLINPAIGQWSQKNSGLYSGIVRSLAVVDDKLVAGTNGGVWASSDQGATWIPSGTGMSNSTAVISFAVQGSDLWAGTLSGVFKSTDKGITWQSRSDGLGPALGRYIFSIVVSNSMLFVATQNGVYRSTDGTNWAQTGFSGKYVYGMGEYGGKVYACTRDGVYVSSNNGTDWTSLGIDSFSLCILVTDTYILVGGSGGISLSTNNGSSWQSVFHRMTRSLTKVGSAILAGTASEGVYISNNNGATWSPTGPGLSTKDVQAVTSMGSKIFAGTWGGAGLFVSNNSGGSWAASNNGMASIEVPAFAAAGDKLFMSMYTEGVYVTSDGGESWAPANDGLTNKYVTSLVANSTHVFAGTFGAGVFRSDDGGAHWSAANSGLSNLSVLKVQVIGTTLYASTYNGIFYSDNNGTSWVPIGPADKQVFSMAKSGSNLLAATGNPGVHVSSDNGASWTVSSTTTLSWHSCFLNAGNQVLSATFGKGIFLSNNNGSSWSAVGTGLSSSYVSDLAPNHTNIFAATGTGVFLSDDNAIGWASDGLNQDIRSLIVFQGSIFAGTYGRGVFSRPLLSLSSFTPSIGKTGTTVTITGTDFSKTPGNNAVSFNGVAATVTVSSANSLTVTVPTGATSGKIAVIVNGKTVTSADNFTVDDTAPTLSAAKPADNATGVSLSSNLELTFSEPIQKGTGNILIKEGGVTRQTIDVSSASVTVTGAVVTIDPVDFAEGLALNVELGAGVFKDLATNDYAGISDAAAWNFKLEIVTGVERNASDFNVYPNPTTGAIRIESRSEIDGTVGLYNLLGSKLAILNLSRGLENQSGELDLEDWPAAVYILVLKTSQTEKRVRIQKY